jgi:hypothetical protein
VSCSRQVVPSPCLVQERLLDLAVLVARDAVVEGSIRKEQTRHVRVGPREPGAGGNHLGGSRRRVRGEAVVVGPEAAVHTAAGTEAVVVGRAAAALVASQPDVIHELQEEPSLHATELESRNRARSGRESRSGTVVNEVCRSLIVHGQGRL